MMSNKKPKNVQRQAKIDKAVQRYETSLLNKLHKYETGEEVDTVTDGLGNKYIYVDIGDNYSNLGRSNIDKTTNWNSKTNAIYTQLYERMKKHGFVLCQKGLHDDGRRGVQAWLLVEHNANPPEEKKPTQQEVINSFTKPVVDYLYDTTSYTGESLEGQVDEFVRQQAMDFMKNMMKKKDTSST